MPFERKDQVLKKTRDRWRNKESQESLALKKRKREGGKKYIPERKEKKCNTKEPSMNFSERTRCS